MEQKRSTQVDIVIERILAAQRTPVLLGSQELAVETLAVAGTW